jgi:hypothetical protein
MFSAAAQSQRRSPVKHRLLRNRATKPIHHSPHTCKPLKVNEKDFEKKFKVFVTRFS